MNKTIIVTDSTVDLSNEEAIQHNIEIVPLSISIDGEHFTDRVDITPNEFIKRMKESDELPKSSQPPVGMFLEKYEKWISQGYEILSIHMASELSGTVRAAEQAAQMASGKVTVFDSRFISKGLAFQVLEAAKLAKNGSSADEILKRLEKVKQATHLYIVVDTLENLVKGGRIGKGRALIGSLLNIKPIAKLENGQYTPVKKVRSHSQAVSFLVKQFLEDVKGNTLKGVALVHADGQSLASSIKKKIDELQLFHPVSIEETTPVISTHTGPGAVALIYYAE
ncbi:DegV family protein with EDD domain [Bacillus oleivorans]|uniref:DegV family protein with EDD domain n=1 Tax=Bacillus oleivorans TaxID=1448271 RepID=A0A285CMJ5_9BACI|nr:DegV family protein [Bacillus oleivorans]SNX68288.1 DegV family protein with EDD domain [Bacillus oleivorans]